MKVSFYFWTYEVLRPIWVNELILLKREAPRMYSHLLWKLSSTTPECIINSSFVSFGAAVNSSPKMKRILFFLFPFKICIQVFVFWVLRSLAPGEITVFCNDTKASLPPRKGGFTWIPKGCWIPATLGGERDGVLWGREASTTFSEMPGMLKEGQVHGSLCTKGLGNSSGALQNQACRN